MNIDENADIYQVDTGIVLFPDLSKRYDRQIETFSLAYVAFNAPHFADFVIENAPLPSLKMEWKLPKFTTIPKFGV